MTGRRDRGDEPRRPMCHIATTASRSPSAAPFAAGAPSGASATACASCAYSFFERPESISSDETTSCGPRETVKDLLGVFRRDAHSAVADHQFHVFSTPADAEHDR